MFSILGLILFYVIFLCYTEEATRMIAYTVAIIDDFKGTKKSPLHILSDVMTCLINAFLSCHLVFISIDYEKNLSLLN